MTETEKPPSLEICRLRPELEKPLAEFFHRLRQAGDDQHFHPHPLDAQEATRRVRYVGKDLYYVLVEGGEVLVYGILRGWDEGYAVPSLGIVVNPSARGTGLGDVFMRFLHVAARRKGARKVRLKVYPDNLRAVSLYEKLGYAFEVGEAGQLVGTANL